MRLYQINVNKIAYIVSNRTHFDSKVSLYLKLVLCKYTELRNVLYLVFLLALLLQIHYFVKSY